MKTITEYQPLIFAELYEQPEKRRRRRRATFRAAMIAFPALYIVAGVKITADTGFYAWDWQFWLIFVPLFLLGERLLRVLAREAR